MSNVVAMKVEPAEQAVEAQAAERLVPVEALSGDALRAQVRALMGRRGARQTVVAKEVGMSGSAVSQWLNDCYLGDVAAMERRLRRWVQQQGARQAAARALPEVPVWVHTPSAEKVLAVLKFAQAYGDIGLIYGGAGVGKTSAVLQYQRSGLNVWVASMTPACTGLVSALKAICAAVGVEAAGGAYAMHQAIVQRVNKTGGLLVIDEAQHLGIPALEQIRAINDETGIGIALVGNERVYAQMAGGHRAAYLDRVRSRIGKTARVLRAVAGDVKALAGAWQVNAGCEKELQSIASKPGALRGVAKVLKLASVSAAAQGRVVGQEDVRAAWGELGGVA